MDLDAEINRAAELRDLKLYRESIEVCSRLLEAHPECSRAYYTRAGSLRLQQRISEAIEDVRRAIALDPLEPAFRYFCGHWLLEVGDLHEAIQNMDECIRLEQMHEDIYYLSSAYFIRAIARFQLGQFDLALKDCEQLNDSDTTYVKKLYSVEGLKKEAAEGRKRSARRN